MRDVSGIERYVKVMAYLLLRDKEFINLSNEKDNYPKKGPSSQNESFIKNSERVENIKIQNSEKK